jgi:hypothetical protein
VFCSNLVVKQESMMTEPNTPGHGQSNVVRGEAIILQLAPEDLLHEPPKDADFVGVLLATSEARPSYFAGTRVDGAAYDRVSMKFSDRERVWVKVADSGADVTYRMITANQYATSRP